MRTSVRAVGFLVLLGLAGIVYVGLAPKVLTDTPTLPSATQYESLISQALADDRSNNQLTTGAPQQTVVNGWTARDLLTIIAKEQADLLKAQGAIVDATGNLQTQPFDERIPALLVIAIAALAWGSLSAPRAMISTAPPQSVTPNAMPA